MHTRPAMMSRAESQMPLHKSWFCLVNYNCQTCVNRSVDIKLLFVFADSMGASFTIFISVYAFIRKFVPQQQAHRFLAGHDSSSKSSTLIVFFKTDFYELFKITIFVGGCRMRSKNATDRGIYGYSELESIYRFDASDLYNIILISVQSENVYMHY
jgi:hypothetical protein